MITQPDSRKWRTDEFHGREQYDAWVHLLKKTYGNWDVPRLKRSGFLANLSMMSFGDFSVACCACDPCDGSRNRSHIAKEDKEFLVIQLTRRGREEVRIQDLEFTLGPGDIMIWDSTKEMQFSVKDSLDKVSLILPLHRLQSWMPLAWQSVARKIDAECPDAILLKSFIDGLAQKKICNSQVNGEYLSEAVVALLAGTVYQNDNTRKHSLRRGQLRQIKSYINSNLDNPELTLADVARDNDISLRYLHWLFEASRETAARYLRRQRLERCFRDLRNPLMKNRKIADIAHSWGFSDAMHFSRIFKEVFSQRPSDVRAKRDDMGAS